MKSKSWDAHPLGCFSSSPNLPALAGSGSVWSYKWGIRKSGLKLVLEILLNILMFMPVGTLLPIIIRKPRSKKWVLFFITMLTGLCCSCLVEILQLLLKCGLCELDDIIHNVLGTAIGYGIFVFSGNGENE